MTTVGITRCGLSILGVKKMRIERILKGLTQYDIVARTGIHQSKLSLLENGYAVPSLREKKAIAEALGMNPDELTFPNDYKTGQG